MAGTDVKLITAGMIANTTAALNADIAAMDMGGANGAPGVNYTLTLGNNITLDAALKAINLYAGSDLTILGGGNTLDGAGLYRGLFVYDGNVTLDNLTLADMKATGGAGGAASPAIGGGGAGGGMGGAGGHTPSTFGSAGGGGGGIGGAGGLGAPTGGAAGAGGSGLVPGARAAGDGASKSVSSGLGGSGGASGGGGGGGGGPALGGGGGGSGGATATNKNGGAGGFGGGGGAGALLGTGGAGGFGGGGGTGLDATSGAGGFGGGGGGGIGKAGAGGFGGGSGNGGGGGGLGAGGDIFVQQGGRLAIEGGSLAAGTVQGGAGGTSNIGGIFSGSAGGAFGSGLFLQGNQSVTLDPAAGQSLTISGVIADQAGSLPTAASKGAGGLVLNGAGVVTLDATNSFTGNTTLDAGTLDLAAFGAGGSGSIDLSTTTPNLLVIGAADQPGAGATFANTLTNFAGSASLDLPGLAFVPGSTTVGLVNADTLAVGNGTDTLDFLLSGTMAPHYAVAADAAGGAIVSAACYAAGTRIATPGGEVPVEHLAAGETVLALQDGAWVPARVRWVGHVTIDLTRHPLPARVAPVRLLAGAIAPGVPARDLLLSPDHAVFLDGALIQAQALLNGASVAQVFPARIDYWHVELDRHAVLLAEGLPAESYLDTGNRGLFAGTAGVRALHADLAGAAAWDARACAPLLLGGARVRAAHGAVLARAAALGFAQTDDAAFTLRRDGERAWLESRSFVPAWLGLGEDRRRLGVAVARLTLGGRPLPQRCFGEGWHGPEPGLRWTDGRAELLLPRPGRLRATLAPIAARYWLPPPAASARAAV
jgi:hypothetical protein